MSVSKERESECIGKLGSTGNGESIWVTWRWINSLIRYGLITMEILKCNWAWVWVRIVNDDVLGS